MEDSDLAQHTTKLGEYLMRAGLLTRDQLNDALELSKNTGVKLGRALRNRGYVTEENLYRFLSKQLDLPLWVWESQSKTLDQEVARRLKADIAREHGMLPVKEDKDGITLALLDPLDETALQVAAQQLGQKIHPVLITEHDLYMALEHLYWRDNLSRSTSQLLGRAPQDSAFHVLTRPQIIFLLFFLGFSVIWLFLDYRSYLILWNSLFSIYYFLVFMHLIYRTSAQTMEIPVSDEEIAALDKRDLPIYTLLIPVYKEAQVLPNLLNAINQLDYPVTKLDIKILMEADDLDTINVFEQLKLPPHFQALIVPDGQPKTKPKACNYGLIYARGEYVVIFDAEDIPDPDQLKRVLVGFSKSSPKVICIQAKLNYYNRTQNLLTRWFTLEYSFWFDMFLPTLYTGSLPVPLGGSSNHFKKDALIEVGAWDPYNVTEDADVGLRLFKRGYRTRMVDTTTYEEANSDLHNWIRQRSRWMKGYMQTWLVHMRSPIKLYRELGLRGFVSFQLVYGGFFFGVLVNPIYWGLTTLWFLTHWDFIPQLFPGFIYYLAALSLFFGNFAFTYVNLMAGLRRKQFDLVRYALTIPIYWGLISIGAWKGLFQLIYKPHFWEKTIHGLYQEKDT